MLEAVKLVVGPTPPPPSLEGLTVHAAKNNSEANDIKEIDYKTMHSKEIRGEMV